MKLDTRFFIYGAFLVAILLSLLATFNTSPQTQTFVELGLLILKACIALVLAFYIYRVKQTFFWTPLALLVFLPFGFILALVVFFWFQKGQNAQKHVEKTLPRKQQNDLPSKQPVKQALAWSAVLALSPALLVYFINIKEISFLIVSVFLFAVLTPLTLLIALYPSFAPSTKRKVWLISTILILFSIVGYMSLAFYIASLSRLAPLITIGMLLLLAPLSVFIIYTILAGYVLRKVLYSIQQKQLWLGAAALMFFFPFLMWYGAPPVLELLSDGLTQLSNFL